LAQEVHLGDVVQTRKAHPCGADTWEVFRVGADIGLKCAGCGRRVLLTRRAFQKAVKKWVRRAGEAGG
jgi:hypothetical protein